jgi:hypothetical protein
MAMSHVRPPAPGGEARNTNGTILVFFEKILISFARFLGNLSGTSASGQYKFVADSFASITTE